MSEVAILLMANLINYVNKIKNLNLGIYKMIAGIHESKTLAKHISCECKCKFDSRKCNLTQKWNNDKCRWECKY